MTISYTATYDPNENKLRLYATRRLDPDLYQAARDLGFRWAPKQECFICPAWSPAAEDFLLTLCDEIDDEDTTPEERATARAERFEGYAEHREADASAAHTKVHQILDHIPLGQPILVGHHSERRSRADQQRIHDGTQKAVDNWNRSAYWTHRAERAIAHAQYKQRPDVRARRIKTLEKDLRRWKQRQLEAQSFLVRWQDLEPYDQEQALRIANHDHLHHCFPLADYPREPPVSQYEGSMSLWSALDSGIITAAQAADIAIPSHDAMIDYAERWIQHLEHRLTYERAMLEADGGILADQTTPQVGGAVSCWVQGGKWIPILKVNKVSVTVQDNHGNGGRDFTRTIPFDQLKGIKTPTEWQALCAAAQPQEVV